MAKGLIHGRSGAGIKWGGPILYFNGYASHARKCLIPLDESGVSLAIDPYGIDKSFAAQLSQDELNRWRRLMGCPVERGIYVCFALPTLLDGTDVFAHARKHNPGFDAYVGISTFETDRIPSLWAQACNGMDEVWVPSTFNVEAFRRSGVDPERIHVLPTGIDTVALDPARAQPMEIGKGRRFAFLSVFQWSKRKGWDVLLKAYLSAFTSEDDVCLVLRTYPHLVKIPPIRDRIDSFLRRQGHDPGHTPPIVLIEDFVSEERMPSLYAAADAFVLPTRGEGFGLPLMEAMAMGLPVIATRWSGHLDFMNDENSYLVDVENLAPMDPEQMAESSFYTPDQRWAEPSVSHAAALMRHVYENREEARRRGQAARAYLQRHWQPKRTAEWIAKRAEVLLRSVRTGQRPSKASLGHFPTVPGQRAGHSSPASALVWQAPILDPGDDACEARQLIQRIHASWSVRIEPSGRISDVFAKGMDPAERDGFLRLMDTRCAPPYLRLSHGPPWMLQRDPKAAVHIGRTTLDTLGMSGEWIERCKGMDELWVPSLFNREMMHEAGVNAPVVVIPPGVDCDWFHPEAVPFQVPRRRGFAFLSIFEWIPRNGWDLLLEAWARAFKPQEDVCLILRSHDPRLPPSAHLQLEMERRVASFLRSRLRSTESDLAPVIVLSHVLSQHDMPRLYAAADAFVLPSRGEGRGLRFLEAMACGLPVIGTRWGGQLAFMSEESSYLIDIERLAPAVPDPGHPPCIGQLWSIPSVDHLTSLLRRVFEDTREAQARGRRARLEMTSRWTWEHSSQAVLGRLYEIKNALRFSS